jgi:son of sevenless-like protein
MIEDGNADMLPCPTAPNRKLIHFAKRQKCADVIREIQQYQATPYTFNRLEMVLVFLRERLEYVESAPDAYDLSIKLEPRERDDEKM